MDYEKKYKEALERAREIKEKIMYSHLSTESCKAVSEYIDTIIPELSESEDERIRNKIIDIVCASPFDEEKDVLIAWLEKQKDCNCILWRKSDNVTNPDKPYVDKAGWFYTTDGRMCPVSEIEKQKEQNTDKCQGCNNVKGCINCVDGDQWAHIEEQKPMEIHIENPNIQKLDPNVVIETRTDGTGGLDGNGTGGLDGKALLYTADKSYQIGFRDGVNSVKPAEWSEEDEDMLNCCVMSINEAKESRSKITDALAIYDEEIDWLKSLRPSWKPSEEQMEALKENIDFAPDTYKLRCTLVSLYNDLKKLKGE